MSDIAENSIAPAKFDLDAWIDGTTGLTHLAVIYQRGDLLAELDRIQRKMDASKEVAAKERGVADGGGLDELIAQFEEIAEQMLTSAITVHVQDRTEARRRQIRDNLIKGKKLNPKNDDDSETIYLHQLADSIIKVETPDGKILEMPEGFPVNKLRELKDRLGDAALYDAMEALRKVTQEAPTVAAPLSRRSSSGRGGIT